MSTSSSHVSYTPQCSVGSAYTVAKRSTRSSEIRYGWVTSRSRTASRHRVAPAGEVAEELVVEGRLPEQLLQRGVLGRRVLEHPHHVGVLVAEEELHRPVLVALEPRARREEGPDLRVLARREGREDVPLLDELLLHVLDPGQPLEGRGQLVRGQQRPGRVQLVEEQLHPQLGHLVLDDEEQLVVLRGLAARVLGREQRPEVEVVPVRHRLREVGGDALLEGALGAVGGVAHGAIVPAPSRTGGPPAARRRADGARPAVPARRVVRHRPPGRGSLGRTALCVRMAPRGAAGCLASSCRRPSASPCPGGRPVSRSGGTRLRSTATVLGTLLVVVLEMAFLTGVWHLGDDLAREREAAAVLSGTLAPLTSATAPTAVDAVRAAVADLRTAGMDTAPGTPGADVAVRTVAFAAEPGSAAALANLRRADAALHDHLEDATSDRGWLAFGIHAGPPRPRLDRLVRVVPAARRPPPRRRAPPHRPAGRRPARAPAPRPGPEQRRPHRRRRGRRRRLLRQPRRPARSSAARRRSSSAGTSPTSSARTATLVAAMMLAAPGPATSRCGCGSCGATGARSSPTGR